MVLSLGEREEISRGLSTQCSLRSIARRLGRSPSTISREVRRNGGPERYRAARSDQVAWDRAQRPKLCKLACCPFLARTVSAKLQLNWSPEQIAGWLKRTFPGEAHNQVSHETIYRSLFIQARGVLKKEVLEHLRARRTIRRSRHASMKPSGLGQIKDAISIQDAEAAMTRALVLRPGTTALNVAPPTSGASPVFLKASARIIAAMVGAGLPER